MISLRKTRNHLLSIMNKSALKKFFLYPKKLLGKIVRRYFRYKRQELLIIGETYDLINQTKKQVEMLLTFSEARQIYLSVKSTEKIPGDIAEVGIYKGGSAKLICEARKGKTLYLFDTFEGHPEVSDIDPPQHSVGRFKTSLEKVKQLLGAYQDVYFYKGSFPETAGPISDKRFSFVHLDVDLYKGTLESLEFFYNRINRGGVIIVHDYPSLAGVVKAVDDFFRDKPEPILQPTHNQALIVKL